MVNAPEIMAETATNETLQGAIGAGSSVFLWLAGETESENMPLATGQFCGSEVGDTVYAQAKVDQSMEATFDSLTGTDREVLVTCSVPSGRLSFRSKIKYRLRPLGRAGSDSDRLMLAWPEAIAVEVFRSDHRVHLGTAEVRVGVELPENSTFAEENGEPMRVTRIRDISSGGVGLFIRTGRGNPGLRKSERVRITISYGDAQLSIEGRVAHPTRVRPDSQYIGIAFDELASFQQRETRHAVQRLVADLGRLEARRARLH